MKERIAREIGHALTGVGFLTRLPVPAGIDQGRGRLARAARYFPLVGLLIGGISACVLLVASAALPASVAAGLAIGAGVLITGALHEDGLADTADGLGGGRTPARVLEIMRDSRTGAYGAVALVFSVGLRWAALAGLAPGAGALALVIAHGVGRAMMVPALAFASYARADGLASEAGTVRAGDAGIALLIALLVALTGGGAGLIALAVGAAGAVWMLAMLVRRIGGYTGDGLGALEQAAETAALVTLAGCWG